MKFAWDFKKKKKKTDQYIQALSSNFSHNSTNLTKSIFAQIQLVLSI